MNRMRTAVLALATTACAVAVAQGPAPGYGPGYGPGMMGGYGPGAMMGGYGGPGRGPGMMGPYGYANLPDLTADQRTKIAEIQREYRARQWPLMQQMQELQWNEGSGGYDEQAERRDYDRIAGLQKQMFENSLDVRKRIDGVLTPQQRDALRRGWGGRR